jgi:hypothetical protein
MTRTAKIRGGRRTIVFTAIPLKPEVLVFRRSQASGFEAANVKQELTTRAACSAKNPPKSS